jgi:large subunit ribosomal protein L13
MKTYIVKNGTVERNWWVVDAEGQTLGRLTTKIATILRGKNKPEFSLNVDVGDFVIVVNAEKVKLTGKKEFQKKYQHHSGIPGGFKERTVEKMRQLHPEKIIESAVKGMLPKGTLGTKQLRKLKVYTGPAHPHKVQKPKVLEGCTK